MDTSKETHISATGRLFALLSRIGAAGGGSTVLDLFIVATGDEPRHPRSGYRLLATVYDLIEVSRGEIEATPSIKKELYFRALNNIDVLFRNTPVTVPANVITDALKGLLVSLEFCADQLDRLSEEVLLADADVEALIADVEALLADLRTADLPVELKAALIRRAEELRGALSEYAVHGAAGLERAVAASLGSLMQHRGDVHKHSKSSSLIKYVETVVKLDSALRAVYRWAQLAGPPAMKLLGDIASAAS